MQLTDDPKLLCEGGGVKDDIVAQGGVCDRVSGDEKFGEGLGGGTDGVCQSLVMLTVCEVKVVRYGTRMVCLTCLTDRMVEEMNRQKVKGMLMLMKVCTALYTEQAMKRGC